MTVLSMQEYLKKRSLKEREAYYSHELPADILEELEKDYQGADTPELDHLLEE